MVYTYIGPGQVFAAGAIFAVLTATISTARLFVQYSKHSTWHVEDGLIIPATIMSVGIGILTCYGVSRNAFGYLTPPIEADGSFSTEERLNTAFIWSCDWMQVIALANIKMSLVFYYRRIFSVSRTFNLLSMAFLVLMVVWEISFFLGFVLACNAHPEAQWNNVLEFAQNCKSLGPLALAYSWSDFTMDVIVFVFPIPPILKLQMSLSRKIKILALFALGAGAIAFSLVRAILFTELVSAFNSSSFDENMINTNNVYWNNIETGLALCTANLAVLYSLRQRIHPRELWTRLKSLASVTRSHGSDDDGTSHSWRQPLAKKRSHTSSIEGPRTSVQHGRQTTPQMERGNAQPLSIFVEQSFGMDVQRTRTSDV